MPSPFTWNVLAPDGDDLLRDGDDLIRADKTTLASVLGTLAPTGTPTVGWRNTQISNVVWITKNARWNGTNWVRDDIAVGSTAIEMNGTSILFWNAAAAAGNITWVAVSFAASAHASTHQDGGSDEISVTGLSGLLATPQTPAAHATAHQSGGGDSIKLDDLATPDDNTDLNATSGHHGLLLKLTGSTANFLRADGTWASPGGGAPAAHATSHQAGGSDPIALDTLAAPTDITTLNASLTAHGLLLKLGGGTSNFLRADGTWAAPPGGSLGIQSFKRLYANTVTGAAVTSWSVTTGLAGDTDLIYMIKYRLIEAQLNTVLRLTFNNDTGANYGDTGISVTNTTVTGTRNSAQANFPIAFVNAAGHSASGIIWVSALSGQVRHIFLQFAEQVAATVVTTGGTRQGVWINTANEIIRMDVVSSIASGIGIGSRLEIWGTAAV